MFKKILASFGKGAATVDLILNNHAYNVGDTIKGKVVVRGGEVTQKIKKIEVGLFLEVEKENGSESFQVSSIPVSSSFEIHADEEKALPFSYELPCTIPISSPAVSYYFDTHLDIEYGVDKKDIDYLRLYPEERVLLIFEALNKMGFEEKYLSGGLDTYGQEFSFSSPASYAHKLNEIDLRFATEKEGVRLWIECDIQSGYVENEIQSEIFIDNQMFDSLEKVLKLLTEHIESIVVKNQYPTSYQSYEAYADNYYHHHEHSNQQDSFPFGIVGGFVAGTIGAVLAESLIEELIEDEQEENEYDESESGDSGSDD